MTGGNTRSTTALARLERVLVMVPWLLEHQGATFDEIAERFDASPEEVAADLDTLGYCGLPGYGGGDLVEVTTFGDSVTVRMADFFTRPLRLSLREAVTMLLAARSLAQVDGLPETQALQRAVDRLEQLLGESSTLGGDEVRVAVDVAAEGDAFVAPLRDAINARRVVRIRYRSASKAETTTRDVEPWSVLGASGAWYLRGYCRMVQAHRDFRLDRIAELEVLEDIVTPRAAEPDDLSLGYRPTAADTDVLIEVRRPAWWLIDELVVDDVTDHGEWRSVALRTGAFEWLARKLLRLGADAVVRRPADLEDRRRALAAELLDQYEEST